MMTDTALNRILDQATTPPPCPSDKLVAQMFAHMDGSAMTGGTFASQKSYFAWGSIAAALLLAFGIMSNLPNSVNIGTAPDTIVATSNSFDGIATDTATATDYADDFANQLIGYDDISVIVPINDL